MPKCRDLCLFQNNYSCPDQRDPLYDTKFPFQGDLAARNVLLTHDMKAKIADFGLSIRIYSEKSTYAVRKGKKDQSIPFRWAATEVLRGETAIKEYSDVWSFGVLMWEIFYLGFAVPYGDKKEYEEVVNFLQEGNRLNKPPLCPPYIYDLMLDCWNEDYLLRPVFLHLKDQLEKSESKKYSIPNCNVESREKFTYLQMT